MNNYIIIGDSITYGIGDVETSGWASMFKEYIVSKDNTKVCNNFVHIVGFPGANGEKRYRKQVQKRSDKRFIAKSGMKYV